MLLLPRGAFPSAGIELVESVRDYDRELDKHPKQARAYYCRRQQAEFSSADVLSEYFNDPLCLPCLSRPNWEKLRPKLFVSTYITERDNLVIEVRPSIESGFSYMNMVHGQGDGDFRRFIAYTAPFQRPSNRVLYVPLGRELTHATGGRHPWDTGHIPPEKHSRERHLCVLSIQAKLHQLSLYFDCYVDRRLVEFGDHHFIDFRDAWESVEEDSEIVRGKYFEPGEWIPPRIRKLLATSGLRPQDLYDFALLYLPTVSVQNQLKVYADYLSSRHPYQLTQADLDELIQAADPGYRATMRLAELETDSPRFSAEITDGFYQFQRFCSAFGFTSQSAALDWVLQHHPDALTALDIPARYLVGCLTRWATESPPNAQIVEVFDRKLSERLKKAMQFHYYRNTTSSLEAVAADFGFNSFSFIPQWAKAHAPKTAVAYSALVESLEERDRVAKAEKQARRAETMQRRKSAKAKAAEGGSA